jgi:type II secretory pathway component PulM
MDPIAMIALGVVLLGLVVLSIGVWHPARRRTAAETQEDLPERQWEAQATLAEMRQEGADLPDEGSEGSPGVGSARPG